MNNYELGDLIRVKASTFTDPNDGDAPIDPTTVTVIIKTPAGVVTAYVYGVDAAVKKAAVGDYYMDVSANEAGQDTYRWIGTGVAQAADEESFLVDQALAQ